MYCVSPDEEAVLDGDLRIIDESGEDYLYPAEYFLILKLPDEIEHISQESFSRNQHSTVRIFLKIVSKYICHRPKAFHFAKHMFYKHPTPCRLKKYDLC